MILVTPLSGVEAAIRAYRPSHLVTLLSPAYMIDTPQGIEAWRHLKLSLNDVSELTAEGVAPSARHVEELLEFGREWDASAPLLVHCWAGISRSTAAAFILLCDRLGPGSEQMIAQGLRARAPHAFPNPLLVSLADEILDRQGRMIAAVEAIGRGRVVSEGVCVELPLRNPLP